MASWMGRRHIFRIAADFRSTSRANTTASTHVSAPISRPSWRSHSHITGSVNNLACVAAIRHFTSPSLGKSRRQRLAEALFGEESIATNEDKTSSDDDGDGRVELVMDADGNNGVLDDDILSALTDEEFEEMLASFQDIEFEDLDGNIYTEDDDAVEDGDEGKEALEFSSIEQQQELERFADVDESQFDFGEVDHDKLLSVDEMVALLEEEGLSDVVVIDLREKADFADYMVVATAHNWRHMSGAATRVVEELNERIPGDNFEVEGQNDQDWMLVDAENIIVHFMTKEWRSEVDLEELWSSRPRQE